MCVPAPYIMTKSKRLQARPDIGPCQDKLGIVILVSVDHDKTTING